MSSPKRGSSCKVSSLLEGSRGHTVIIHYESVLGTTLLIPDSGFDGAADSIPQNDI